VYVKSMRASELARERERREREKREREMREREECLLCESVQIVMVY
jgi:hypothetical protein